MYLFIFCFPTKKHYRYFVHISPLHFLSPRIGISAYLSRMYVYDPSFPAVRPSYTLPLKVSKQQWVCHPDPPVGRCDFYPAHAQWTPPLLPPHTTAAPRLSFRHLSPTVWTVVNPYFKGVHKCVFLSAFINLKNCVHYWTYLWVFFQLYTTCFCLL